MHPYYQRPGVQHLRYVLGQKDAIGCSQREQIVFTEHVSVLISIENFLFKYVTYIYTVKLIEGELGTSLSILDS